MIPEHELKITYAHSGGPGGQNVNKVETKAVVHWNIGASAAFSVEQKERIREFAKNRVNKADELYISADDTRSRDANRDAAIGRMNAIVVQALTPVKERKATKPSRAEKRRRLDDKSANAKKKKNRRPPKGEW